MASMGFKSGEKRVGRPLTEDEFCLVVGPAPPNKGVDAQFF